MEVLKKMKKKILLFLLVCGLVIGLGRVPNANAFTHIDTYWDLNAVATPYFTADGGDGVTELFSEFTYYAQTNSAIDATGGIIDSGLAWATSINPVSGSSPVDNEALNTSYLLTFAWTDLTGQVTSNDGSTVTAVYTSGTFDFYIDYAASLGANFSTPSTFTDGTKVATVEITSGSYTLSLDGSAGSSYILNGEFTWLLDDFWFDEYGQDLDDYPAHWAVAYTAGDNDPKTLVITPHTDGSIDVFSTHDSSMEVGVIPEPATMLLLGSGLLGLAGIVRKKKFFKKD